MGDLIVPKRHFQINWPLVAKTTHSMLRTTLNATFEKKQYFHSMKCQILFCKRRCRFETKKGAWKYICRSLLGGSKQVGFSMVVTFHAVMVIGWDSKVAFKLHSSCTQFTATVRVAGPSNPNITKWGQVCLSAWGCTSYSIDVDVLP